MFGVVIVLFFAVFLARDISSYDERYNQGKFIIIKNKTLSKVLLSKTTGFSRHNIKRSKKDFNKMTITGLIFYLCIALIIITILLLYIFASEIKVTPLEIDSRYLYVIADTIYEKVPLLLAFILLSAEILFEFKNVIIKAKEEKVKWLIVLSCFLMFLVFLFGAMQLKELVYCFFNC